VKVRFNPKSAVKSDHFVVMFQCENDGCDQIGTKRCTRCTTAGYPEHVGLYCSKACQESHWSSKHKAFHNLTKKKATSTGIMETLTWLLYQFHLSSNLPILSDDGEFSITFLGARESFEGEEDYGTLYNCVKTLIYPSITKLTVTMIGPEVNGQRPQRLGPVTINRIQGLADSRIDPRMFEHDVAIIFQPALSSNTASWKTVIGLLRDWNALTIVSSYSHDGHKTYDAVHDESILVNYFGVQITLSSFLNPSRWEYNGVCKNCFICAFRGPTTNSEFVPWSDKDLLHETRLAFLGSLITIFNEYEGRPDAGRSCQNLSTICGMG